MHLAEDKLTRLKYPKEEIVRLEEGHWNKFSTIQSSKKDRDMDKMERSTIDTWPHATMATTSTTTKVLKTKSSKVAH